ncbi:dihydroorotate dehydrogenase (quinone) [Companilactobacillus sp. RD055328]|uniref:quinone-dependent dihydroorotate dehydrogenase n=1 Tax=Companilactobacillus sp. RD055328 TaxID=2916634 RepID=UPI001FC83CAB|nr:quinone-dependent dihydroorotate dehydrogenase [Companilactobacillus sp. RD055328]GKQ42785.1 dihydroorotate dehydrogenase (quinone) [Companilactobacillus sp. RD055328]
MILYRIMRPIAFALDPETDHKLVADGLAKVHRSSRLMKLTEQLFKVKEHNPVTIGNVEYKNKVGMAAGFDKNGEFYNGIAALGAGFVEIGSVTLRPQDGNKKPRAHRLSEDKALINNMGLNNVGVKKVRDSIAKVKPETTIGLSVAPNHGLSTEIMIKEMAETVSIIEQSCDFITLNLSCPNQEGVQSLQTKDVIVELLNQIKTSKPIFLKFSSDLDNQSLKECLDSVVNEIEGVVLSNTSKKRESLVSKNQNAVGGLSGKPLFKMVLKQVRYIKENYGEDLVIMHSGGIFNAEDAKLAIEAGADLIQIYSGMIYEGPSIFKNIINTI